MVKVWENPEFRIKHCDFQGTLYPFQNLGTAFLALNKNCLLTFDTGLGKSPMSIAAYDLLKNKYPDLQIVVITLKSTQRQWKSEFKKFLPTANVESVEGTPINRKKTYKRLQNNELCGIIVNYSQITKDLGLENPSAYFGFKCSGPLAETLNGKKYLLILDEIQQVKNVSAIRSKCAKWLADNSYHIKGLTATPVYNHLLDIYGIFKHIEPSLFKNKSKFQDDFCIINYHSGFFEILGYKNHDLLKQRIKPFTLSKTKDEAGLDLPALVPISLFVELPPNHKKVYDRIENGLVLHSDTIKTVAESVGDLIRAQVAANALEQIDNYEGPPSHPKLDEALRVIKEDLEGQKVLIYSKFEKTISIIEHLLSLENIPVYRITGKENLEERESNKNSWESQDGTSIMAITGAGGAGLNLQAASTIIFIDRPYSPGEVHQIRGRIHRIGSKHKSLLEIHIIAEGTIDEDIINSLAGKLGNIEKVLGQQDKSVNVNDIVAMIKARRKK